LTSPFVYNKLKVMLVIRLIRVGKKHSPDFRMVVTDKKNPPRGGRFLEMLGHYNPKLKQKNFKEERIRYWLKNGAKLSDTCHNLLVGAGIIKAKKIKLKISSKGKGKPEEGKLEEKSKEKAEEKPKLKKGPKEEKSEEKKEPSSAKASDGEEKKE